MNKTGRHFVIPTHILQNGSRRRRNNSLQILFHLKPEEKEWRKVPARLPWYEIKAKMEGVLPHIPIYE